MLVLDILDKKNKMLRSKNFIIQVIVTKTKSIFSVPCLFIFFALNDPRLVKTSYRYSDTRNVPG